MKPVKVIFAGGGTGGHLFPALAIAEKLKQVRKSAEILFIGTRKGIEGKIIPNSDFEFLPIRISGVSRERNLLLTILKNLLVPLEILIAVLKSFWLLSRNKPDAVVGTGGFVSGPPLIAATLMGIPTLIHEQNSYPGITTRLLAGRVTRVHLGMEKCLKYLKKKD
ncbi:MAG: glycosyltransferase [Candidatus Marinimicrobia bacterium]|nr:glycosyltransferase [Candidatus Neomarinimicrobiota bacterium]